VNTEIFHEQKEAIKYLEWYRYRLGWRLLKADLSKEEGVLQR